MQIKANHTGFPDQNENVISSLFPVATQENTYKYQFPCVCVCASRLSLQSLCKKIIGFGSTDLDQILQECQTPQYAAILIRQILHGTFAFQLRVEIMRNWLELADMVQDLLLMFFFLLVTIILSQLDCHSYGLFFFFYIRTLDIVFVYFIFFLRKKEHRVINIIAETPIVNNF